MNGSRPLHSADRPGLLPAVAGLMIAALLLFLPSPLFALLRVSVDSITTRSGVGVQKSTFIPGEAIRYQARISVLNPSPGIPFNIRLRITGDGWYEVLEQEVFFPVVVVNRVISWGVSPELYTSTDVCEGDVSLHLDIASSQEEEIIVGGRRHGYFTIRCLSDLPSGVTVSIPVGLQPLDMAFTGNGRFLYVTSRESRNISVIDTDLEPPARIKVIPDWEQVEIEVEECRSLCPEGDNACRRECKETIEPVGEPTGVEASADGTKMYVADYRRPVIHVVDAQQHTLEGDISLAELRPMNLWDLAVNHNPQYNEIYATDFGDARVIRVNLDDQSVRALDLHFSNPLQGNMPGQILIDPLSPTYLYVLGAQVLHFTRNGLLLYPFWMNFPVISWYMALNPLNTLVNRDFYVVMSPGVPPTFFPFEPQSFIYFWSVNGFVVTGEAVQIGTSIGDLVVRDDGRYAYTTDSYRGEILLVDLERKAELRGCAIPVRVGALNLRADPNPLRNRLYVGTWAPGSVEIVE